MKPLRTLLLCLTLGLASIVDGANAAAPADTRAKADSIAWFAGDVDAAFAQARREHKPLFLYWGAVWCPPCNQVKATIFPRQDFVARSRLFVPVYLDGDAPNAQKTAARFKVSAYPTMILFRADGTEITRLPGEVDGSRYMQVLQLGLNAGRPVQTLLATARKSPASLSANDWRMLAFYSWETDHQNLVPRAQLPGVLWQLAQASRTAAPDASARLTLKAVALAAGSKSKDESGIDKSVASAAIGKALADDALARANFVELSNAPQDSIRYLAADAKARAQLASAWDLRLARFADDAGLSRIDRLGATSARVALAHLDSAQAPLPLALQTEVRGVALRADRESTDRYERGAVIPSAADVLADAGLLADSDALLQAELKRSATPYYLMSGLASNARKRGDTTAALNWYEQAYASSQGPATRLQWGASYVRALVDLAPQSTERIERAATAVIADIEPKPETFYERNRSALERMAGKLADWNRGGQHDAALGRLRTQMTGVCAKLPAAAVERKTCDGLLVPRST